MMHSFALHLREGYLNQASISSLKKRCQAAQESYVVSTNFYALCISMVLNFSTIRRAVSATSNHQKYDLTHDTLSQFDWPVEGHETV
mmetsp:Transcript_4098/g.8671  ORF Transcript_4098/g.8671 Transcript_4098/m.8671 type:complete len:87 (-) Transcript_4098:372-632(-)